MTRLRRRRELPMTTDLTFSTLVVGGGFTCASIKEETFPAEEFRVGKSPKLYYFDKARSTRDVIEKMAAEGYRPGTLGDLLKFSAQEPKFWGGVVIALGSIVGEGYQRQAPMLSTNGWDRNFRGLLLMQVYEEDRKVVGQYQYLGVRAEY